MISKILITRDYVKNNELEIFCESQQILLHECSLLIFEQVDFQQFPKTDWIFFYSKNAVRFFLGQIDSNILKLNGTKIATLGKGAATIVNQFDLTVDFCGDGIPENVIHDFSGKVNAGSILFPRAENSKQSVEKGLSNEFITIPLIVYRNYTNSNIQIQEDYEAVIFTSPLNVEAFFKVQNREIQGTKWISIGKTTAQTLSKYVDTDKIITSQKPNDHSLVEIIRKLI
ncbi:MAG: uroporphyrinogen-III synthase [Saprospiraceae bacterium]|nr:uroporphyrinogen-III synthase [Saprospiraceae bacterium]